MDHDYIPRERLVAELARLARRVAMLETEQADREKAVRELCEKAERYSALIRSFRDPVFLTGRDGSIVEFNAAAIALLGYAPGELTGLGAGGLYAHPHDRDRFQEAIERDGAVTNFEVKLRKKDGTVIDCLATGTVRRSPDGQIIGYQGSIRDVTAHHQIRQALADSEHRYRLLSELTSDFAYAFSVDTDGSLSCDWITGALSMITGYTAEQLKSLSWLEKIVDPDDAKIIQTQLATLLAGEPREVEYRIITKSGEERWLRDHARPVLDDDETRVTHIYGAIKDITAQRQAEEAVRASQRMYQSIFDTSLDGIVFAALDGRIEDANQAYLDMHGHTLDEIKDMTYYQLTPEKWWKIEDEIDRTQLMVNGFSDEYEKEHIRRDGTVFPVLVRTFLVRDEQGRPTRTWAHVRDITQAKRAQELQSVMFNIAAATSEPCGLDELSETIHRELGRLIDTTNFYVALYDQENDWYTFPYEVDEQDQTDLNTPVRLQGSLTDYVRRTGKPLLVDLAKHEELMASGEAELVGAQSLIWLGAPLRAEDRTIGVAAVQTYSENTVYTRADLDLMTFVSDHIAVAIARKQSQEDRQRLECRIQHAQKLESLGILAGGIAHDFNNLLTGVLGNADLALTSLNPASPAFECVQYVRISAVRAAELCSQMLAYSGRGSFVVTPLNLNEIVQEVVQLLRVSVSKKAEIKYDLEPELPAVVADATQIRQMLMNLVTNASDALANKIGTIRVRTAAVKCDRVFLVESKLEEQLDEGAYVCIEVSDTGSGMNRQTLERVFDPFFTTKFTGRGLGLAAAQGIVRGHKGAIQAESRPGLGTTFRIFLPSTGQILEPRKEPVALMDCIPELGCRPDMAKVLLVDDEEHVRSVGCRMLTEAGFTVVTAADGREALQYFQDHADEIGCVLLDLTMPLMDGRETYRELRQINSDVPVLLSSGYSEREAISHFDDGEISGFIPKPYVLWKLVSEVKAAILSGERSRTLS